MSAWRTRLEALATRFGAGEDVLADLEELERGMDATSAGFRALEGRRRDLEDEGRALELETRLLQGYLALVCGEEPGESP